MAGLLLTAVVVSQATACDRAPAEPESRPVQRAPKERKTLHWTVPPSWSLVKDAKRGKYRAKYTIPAQGDSKHTAELLIQKVQSPDVERRKIIASFDRREKPSVEQGQKKVGRLRVEWVDVLGTYKFPVGPPIPHGKRKGQHAAHMLKSNWRALAATVVTQDRGQWLLHIVGPKDTVSAARSSFFNLLDSLK